MLCRKLGYNLVRRGMWAGTPGVIKSTNIIKVQLYLLDKSESGRSVGIRSNFTDHVFCSTWEQVGRIGFDQDMLMPGENTTGHIVFVHDMPVRENMSFTIRESSSKTVARGIITQLYKPIFVDSFRKFYVNEFVKNAKPF